jgi:hypothetical protein
MCRVLSTTLPVSTTTTNAYGLFVVSLIILAAVAVLGSLSLLMPRAAGPGAGGM